MGNLNTTSNHAGKVVLPDGSIHEFQEPITAAELMLEHPQQMVVEFNYKKERLVRPSPLPADRKLEANKIYLMLPLKRGRLPSFPSLKVNSILTQSLLSCSSSKTLRLFAKIRPLNVGDGHGFSVPRKDDDADEDEGYLKCRASGKGWKPSLDTIKENKERKKELNLVVLASKVGKRVETKGLVWG